MGQNGPLGLGREILPTEFGSKVGQNGDFTLLTFGKKTKIHCNNQICTQQNLSELSPDQIL